MFLPALSSPRVPMQVRLYICIATTLGLAPTLLDLVDFGDRLHEPGRLVTLIVSETAIGATMGMAARMLNAALQFMFSAVVSFIGLSGIGDPPVEDHEPAPALATLMTFIATMIFFAVGLHWQLIGGLIQSYEIVEAGRFSAQFALDEIQNVVARTFLVALQIASPLLVYSVIANFCSAVINKASPQIPIYFVAQPFVLAGGLLLLWLTIGEQVHLIALAVDASVGGR